MEEEANKKPVEEEEDLDAMFDRYLPPEKEKEIAARNLNTDVEEIVKRHGKKKTTTTTGE